MLEDMPRLTTVGIRSLAADLAVLTITTFRTRVLRSRVVLTRAQKRR